MTLGDVLRKERDRTGLSAVYIASLLNMTEQEYGEMERGDSAAEKWGPLLARIAIVLEVPTSRLLSESGKAADIRDGEVGCLIARWRIQRNVSTSELAGSLGLSEEEYEAIEQDNSPIGQVARCLLRFAEAIEQPVFNLFYPCGLPLKDLDSYP